MYATAKMNKEEGECTEKDSVWVGEEVGRGKECYTDNGPCWGWCRGRRETEQTDPCPTTVPLQACIMAGGGGEKVSCVLSSNAYK